MKLDSKKGTLVTNNRVSFEDSIFAENTVPPLVDLLRLISDVCDTAAAGADCYMVIGTNRDKTALLLTVTQDNRKGYISAVDLVALSEACKSLL